MSEEPIMVLLDPDREFKPCVVAYPDSGLAEMMLEDVPSYAAETRVCTILRAMDDRRIIGVMWAGSET